jgi:hypothetical protein
VGKYGAEYTRVERDLYPTPAWVTEALLAYVDLAGLTVWEPATGKGDMAEVLKASGAACVHCSDIIKYDYPLDEVRDFTVINSAGSGFDAIITNPPSGPGNKTAEAFITAGLHYIARGGLLALLLSTDFDSGSTRRELFQHCPRFYAKIELTKRVVWFERLDGRLEQPRENHAWYIWQRTPLRVRESPRVLYAPIVNGSSRTEGNGP